MGPTSKGKKGIGGRGRGGEGREDLDPLVTQTQLRRCQQLLFTCFSLIGSLSVRLCVEGIMITRCVCPSVRKTAHERVDGT